TGKACDLLIFGMSQHSTVMFAARLRRRSSRRRWHSRCSQLEHGASFKQFFSHVTRYKSEVVMPKQDAIALLKADHAAVKKLFAQEQRATKQDDEKKQSIFDQIKDALTVHATIEE